MSEVPVRAPGVVTWSWFIDDTTGHMVVHAEPGRTPIINVHLREEHPDEVCDFSMSASEGFRLAKQIEKVARAARRAEWTPDVVAYVTEKYLFGWVYEDVVEELEKLAEYLSAHRLLQPDGTLMPQADAILKARHG